MSKYLQIGIALGALIGLSALGATAPAQAADPPAAVATPLQVVSPELQEARAALGGLVAELYDQGQITSCAQAALLQMIVDLNARLQCAMLGKTGWTWFDNANRVPQSGPEYAAYDENYRQQGSLPRNTSPDFANDADYHQPNSLPPGTSLTIVLTSDGRFILFGTGYSEAELAELSRLANEQGLAALDWAQLFPNGPRLSVEPTPETP